MWFDIEYRDSGKHNWVQMQRRSLEETELQLKVWWVHGFIRQTDMTLGITSFPKEDFTCPCSRFPPNVSGFWVLGRRSANHSFPHPCPNDSLLQFSHSIGFRFCQVWVSSWSQRSSEGLPVGRGRPGYKSRMGEGFMDHLVIYVHGSHLPTRWSLARGVELADSLHFRICLSSQEGGMCSPGSCQPVAEPGGGAVAHRFGAAWGSSQWSSRLGWLRLSLNHTAVWSSSRQPSSLSLSFADIRSSAFPLVIFYFPQISLAVNVLHFPLYLSVCFQGTQPIHQWPSHSCLSFTVTETEVPRRWSDIPEAP